ncbi:MAG: cation diffusion facilitator family transporter [Lentisphaeria bacterium]|nr:cation diffusion facilitator family transporter [Lentisphaeria bacterium]
MIQQLLIRFFVRDCEHTESAAVRLNYGIFSGYVGLAVNLLLAALKFAVGMLSGSVAVAADAVNNLSDAGNSIITVFGFKLAAKPADREHPFGHGRVEYVAGVVVAVIIVAMGLNFLQESILRIIRPHAVRMSPVMTAIVAGSILLKAWLFFFYREVGARIDSRTIQAMAFDSLSDLAGTCVVLTAVVADQFTAFPVDGCAGVLAALLVLYGGVKILRETINPLLGEPPGPELVEELRSRLMRCEGIRGVHDIIMHNYGPNRYFATAHAEVNLDADILAVHDMLERAEVEIGKHMPVHLLLHCDPCHTSDPEVRSWQGRVENAVAELNPLFKVYDVRLRREAEGKKFLDFHLLVPRSCSVDQADIERKITAAVSQSPSPPRLRITLIQSAEWE